MSRHEGVSCDSCLKSNFNGRRFKCLICYDYDLCADCYEEGATTTRHLAEHPMQCILTRNDIELFFGGEILGTEQPQSYTCPYCKKMGFSDATLSDHVSAEHTDTSSEVVCPVCAGLPGGEPNLVTDDFAGHLTLEHRQGPRELISFLDEPSAIRHGGGVRRIPGRALGGPRSRRSNMHFSSSSGISAISPSGRESVDPIAELLSQLSGVRRGGPQSSQLQQLQMQIQLERQQVTATRQQLERLPRRAHPIVSSSNSSATMAEVISSSNGGPIGSNIGVVASNTSNGNNSGGGSGGSASCRNNEWSVNVSANGQQQGGLTSAAINGRDANGIGFSFASNGNGSTNNALGIIIGGVAGSSTGTANGNLNQVNASSANGAGINPETQSQFLLTKFIKPSLSDEEWAAVEKERADRSQFVQALLLSMLSRSSLDLSDSTEEDVTDAQNASSAGTQKTNGDKMDKSVAQYPQKQENESINNTDGSDKIEQQPEQSQSSFSETVDGNSSDTFQQKKSPVTNDHFSKQNQQIQQEQPQQQNHLNHQHQQQPPQQRQQQSYAAKKKQSKAPTRTASSSNAASAVANVISATTSASVATVGMLNIGNKPTSEKGTGRPPPPATSGVLSVVTSSQSQQPHLQLQLEQEHQQQQLNNSNSHNHQPTQSQSQPMHHQQHHQQPQHQSQTQNQQQQPPNHKTGNPTANAMSSSGTNQIPDSR